MLGDLLVLFYAVCIVEVYRRFGSSCQYIIVVDDLITQQFSSCI